MLFRFTMVIIVFASNLTINHQSKRLIVLTVEKEQLFRVWSCWLEEVNSPAGCCWVFDFLSLQRSQVLFQGIQQAAWGLTWMSETQAKFQRLRREHNASDFSLKKTTHWVHAKILPSCTGQSYFDIQGQRERKGSDTYTNCKLKMKMKRKREGREKYRK